MKQILHEIRRCTVCAHALAHEPRPVVVAHRAARLLIIGQAPGRRVHESGVPWNDPSGNRLREWLEIDSETFYDETKVALVPMGFCFPGTGKSGDLPPRPECAPLWHDRLLTGMPHIKLTLLVGKYAQDHYLGDQSKKTLTETVRNFAALPADKLPLPHPSPRNQIWLKRNPWFAEALLPELRKRVRLALSLD
ncbi:MAG: uracil-DNA glycosylase family protein [Synoicihabitans sp.]